MRSALSLPELHMKTLCLQCTITWVTVRVHTASVNRYSPSIPSPHGPGNSPLSVPQVYLVYLQKETYDNNLKDSPPCISMNALSPPLVPFNGNDSVPLGDSPRAHVYHRCSSHYTLQKFGAYHPFQYFAPLGKINDCKSLNIPTSL